MYVEKLKKQFIFIQNVIFGVSVACAASEADARPALWGAALLAGGGAGLSGALERAARDLASRAPPSHRLKLTAPPSPNERRFAAFIGGSILASMGSFQQMWVSSQEYDEGGKNQLERKCP